jgi:hypothetical protein
MPKYDVKLLIGDMNAKIGREEEYTNITEGRSRHEVSNGNVKVICNRYIYIFV